MWTDVDRRITRALGAVRNAFRGVLTRVDSAPPVQLVQLDGLAGERLQDHELMQHYGLTSNPPPGTMAAVLPLGGRTSHGVVIATEHAVYRLRALASGEVALYTDEGDSIVLHRGRLIEVTTQRLVINAVDAVEINTRSYTCHADTVTQDAPAITHTGASTLSNGFTARGGSGGVVGRIEGTIAATVDVQAGAVSLAHHDHQQHVGPPL
ncbi:phage baseplate assembly protein V [Chitiniphilus eburneus]|uniref:phage baseplate assembly protein V n=1 Tax=Chitiniphilus eburneus TaxID=2571148 RepID=UPI0035CE9400